MIFSRIYLIKINAILLFLIGIAATAHAQNVLGANDPNIRSDVKQILNTYFDSALGIRSDIKAGELLDSMFIDVICKGIEYKSHLHYKFAGIYTYQDFELPRMEPE
jgi:hypothetical protein